MVCHKFARFSLSDWLALANEPESPFHIFINLNYRNQCDCLRSRYVPLVRVANLEASPDDRTNNQLDPNVKEYGHSRLTILDSEHLHFVSNGSLVATNLSSERTVRPFAFMCATAAFTVGWSASPSSRPRA